MERVVLMHCGQLKAGVGMLTASSEHVSVSVLKHHVFQRSNPRGPTFVNPFKVIFILYYIERYCSYHTENLDYIL